MNKLLTLLVLPLYLQACAVTSVAPEVNEDPVPAVQISPDTGFPTYRYTTFNNLPLEVQAYDFPITQHKEVSKWIKFFTQTAKGREYFTMYMLRAEKYVPFIQQHLQSEKMPLDLAYLALIESGFSNYARSHAAAVGLWQFIPATGRRYGLEVDLFRDERRNPAKSTVAAIQYLRDLYAEFGDWALAIAAYNCGEERLRTAIIEAGSSNYWTLMEKRKIPRETANYIPKMIAAILLAKNPRTFPIRYKPLEKESAIAAFTARDPNYQYFKEPLTTIALTSSIDLIKFSLSLGLELKELKIYNPELVGWFTPESYELKIPVSKLAAAAALPPADFEPDYFIYKVPSQISLKKLSKHFNVSQDSILAFNPTLSAHKDLSKGTKLVMPLPKDKVQVVLGLEANPRKRIRY